MTANHQPTSLAFHLSRPQPSCIESPIPNFRFPISSFQQAAQRPREACGVFGIYGHPEAAQITYFGLYALQHRGQESAGIAVHQDRRIHAHKGMGLVPDVFDAAHLAELGGGSAIGHVRYSTTGGSILVNAQPFVVQHRGRFYAVAHNGNLVNAHILRAELE
ncbi:MAG: hypothetical protein DRH76_06870, partial [Deltaproteobacteria bacterium]